MKATKLTPKQREIFERLKATPGGVLRQHIKQSNTVCFRLLDAKINPIANFSYSMVRKLIDKDVLELKGHDYALKATSEGYQPD